MSLGSEVGQVVEEFIDEELDSLDIENRVDDAIADKLDGIDITERINVVCGEMVNNVLNELFAALTDTNTELQTRTVNLQSEIDWLTNELVNLRSNKLGSRISCVWEKGKLICHTVLSKFHK